MTAWWLLVNFDWFDSNGKFLKNSASFMGFFASTITQQSCRKQGRQLILMVWKCTALAHIEEKCIFHIAALAVLDTKKNNKIPQLWIEKPIKWLQLFTTKSCQGVNTRRNFSFLLSFLLLFVFSIFVFDYHIQIYRFLSSTKG